MNLLLGGVCVLIPIIGPIVLLGWLVTVFWARNEQTAESYPPFDFANFGKYLERGLWPFLVTFIPSMLIVPLVWVALIPLMLVGGLSAGNEGNAAACLGLVVALVVILVSVALMLVMIVVLVPLHISAAITQDFLKAFNFAFLKRFVALTWKETVLGSLFLMVAGGVLMCVGLLVVCVGMYFAIVPVYFAWGHLNRQLYALFLSRGGEALPLSAKLRDRVITPPPL